MQIKTAKIIHSKEISELLRDTFKHINSKDYKQKHIKAWIKLDSPKTIKERIQHWDLRNFIAIEKQNIVAFLSFCPRTSELKSLYVKFNKTKQGIGSKLLKFTEDFLKDKGKRQITLNSSKSALNFYKKQGYKEKTQKQIEIDNTKIPVIQMTKML